MTKKPKWERCTVECPEGGYTADLMIEWREEGGDPVIHSVSCDNPRLRDLDNWQCKWTCWDKLSVKKLKKD